MSLREGSLFSGYNGLGMAVSEVFGSEPAWFSEYEPPTDKHPSPAQGAAKILAHRYPDVPNLGDITAIDWDTVEPVDILSGGFPCTDLSLAGLGAGLRPGTRSGLWSYFALGISRLRPRYVVIENVRGLLSAEAHSDVEPCSWCLGEGSGEPDLRALGAVLGDLAGLRYDAQWCGLTAADVGAPHGRFRVFILAWDAEDSGRNEPRLTDRRDGCAWSTRGSGLVTADAGHDRRERSSKPDLRAQGGLAASFGHNTDGCSAAFADPSRDRRDERWSEPAGELGGPDAAQCGASPAQWGEYTPAIRRWERLLGRPAPDPKEPGHKDGERLSPRFTEWMMGLPDGHVTAVPGVNRNAQLKALGNGVVPQQAAAALRHLVAS